MDSKADALVFAVELNGLGGGRVLDAAEIFDKAWPADQMIWAHFDSAAPATAEFLRNKSGLPSIACDALLDESTRPRHVVFDDGVVIILRGVNLNPDSDPERMISMRLWVDQRRVISLRNSKLQVAADLFQLLKEGAGPKTTAGFLVSVVEGVCDRIAPVVDQIEAQVEDIHENTDAPGDSRVLRRQLSDIRRRAIALRRYLSPQRDMVRSLYRISNEWFTDLHRARLREAADQLMGYVEDLDATRDHAYVAQDDIQSALSDQLNRKMYILSIITGLFLPLSFLTGLLGVNVGGIPGAEDPFAFPLLCLGMGLLIGAQILLFKKLKWI